MGVSTCLTGQLLLTQLMVTLDRELKTFVHIQSNTDGIMFSVDRDELDKAREIINEWSKHTRLGMGEIQIKRVIQKDVNNYMIENFEGEIEVRGGYVSDFPQGSFKHNSLSIVAEAIVKYFTDNKSIEDTINGCEEPFRFQLIAKTGSTYDKTIHYVDGDEIQVQKVNRLYAVKNERYGVVKKVKKQYLEIDEDGERRYYINQKGKRTYKKKWETDDGGDYFVKKDTTQNCPEHAIIDNQGQITIDKLDKEWYINLAKKRINDFLGIKETKGGKKKMVKKKEELKSADYPSNEMNDCFIINQETGMTVIDEVRARVGLLRKIKDVGDMLASMAWEMEGYNSNQDYEYVESHKYRENLGIACRKVGLLFKPNIANRQFQKLEATKNMNLTTIYGTVSFIDPDTGMYESYTVMADGADNLDKGIYKAETMLIKYFVLNNFLLPKTQNELDPENGKDEKKASTPVKVKDDAPKSAAPATPKQREEAKEQVVSDKNINKEYAQQLLDAIYQIREAGGTSKTGGVYAESKEVLLKKVIEGEQTLEKTRAVKFMNIFEDKLSELESK